MQIFVHNTNKTEDRNLKYKAKTHPENSDRELYDKFDELSLFQCKGINIEGKVIPHSLTQEVRL